MFLIKVFTLKGLNCPHCSAEIEKEVGRLKNIKSSSINLIKQILTVETSDGYNGNLFNDVEKIVHTHEPDVEIIEDRNNKKVSSHKESTKLFTLKGLDCPHCSAEIEEEISQLKDVKSSSVNLMTRILTVETSDNCNADLFDDVKKIVHTHEPDVEVIENKIDNHTQCSDCQCHSYSYSHSNDEHSKSEDNNLTKKKYDPDKLAIIKIAVGAVIYAVGFIMSIIGNVPLLVELPVLIIAYLILGGDVVLKAVKNILRGHIFDENFLMTVSTVGAFIIGEYPEAAAVMLFYQIGEYIQGCAVNKSRKSISELMDIRPDSANVIRKGIVTSVYPDEVEIGEKIVVKPGEKIPLDGVIIDGESMLDTMALTGESMPRKASVGDNALSGCINQRGVLTIEVKKEFGESTASQIIDLVENAATKKAPAEKFITKFSKHYTPIVVILAALLAVIPPLVLGGGWTEWIHRSFVFLVISCPCALVISIPLTFFGGIGAASKKGVLVKGSNYLEALASIDTIVFDKTGTLTKGVFKVTKTKTYNGFSDTQLIEFAAKAESMSNHPIARSIVKAYGKNFDSGEVRNYKEISGHGVVADVSGHTVIAGSEKLMNKYSVNFEKCTDIGTTIYVSVDGKFAGYAVISDEVKSDSKDAVSKLKKSGIPKTVMLTGDNKDIAKSVADSLNIDEFYAELLPNQKVDELEKLEKNKHTDGKLAFVGDGINDAPVLARADIGIAMGALGSDAAIEAADVVLMTDEPSRIVDAIDVAKYTKKIVMQNIVFVLLIKILFLTLGAFGLAGMWEAVFGDVGVMIIAIINSMRILSH